MTVSSQKNEKYTNIAVLASGSGTILEAIIEAAIPIRVVIADRACRALNIAINHEIEAELVIRDSFTKEFDRLTYSKILNATLKKYETEIVVMAGFGTVLSDPIFESFAGRILNTHPSLLPKFKGWHAVEDALNSGESVTGCTVHIATIGVDEGPILSQKEVPILESDSVESLHERIKEVERKLYPETIAKFVSTFN